MHQLIEAKESCAVTQRHQTLAQITYRSSFALGLVRMPEENECRPVI